MKMNGSKLYTVLTIAGSDPIGGAGIQADLKTISAFGLYGISVITAITAQNTQSVQSVYPLAPEIVAEQLDSVFTDIMPDCVKIGMLANEGIVEAVAEKLTQYRPKRIVLDPIMAASSGKELLNKAGRIAMVEKLFPLATVVTPNLPEAKLLLEINLGSKKDFAGAEEQAAEASKKILSVSSISSDFKEAPENEAQYRRKLAEAIYCFFGHTGAKEQAVLIKGGHMQDLQAEDYLYCISYADKMDKHKDKDKDRDKAAKVTEFFFASPRLDNPNTHGTGCTLSSAIACGLAMGKTIEESVRLAKEYITGAIHGGFSLGKGTGPLDHFWKMNCADAQAGHQFPNEN